MTTQQNRWWIYQKERFPVFAHGPLIMAFSLCALCFSALLRGEVKLPALPVFAVAFITSFISFLHLRLADEFKDFAEDSQFRPYRPVPRGLIKLRELAVLWVITALVQLGMALWLDWPLIFPLLVTWTYFTLMSKEFFCKDWLKARPFTYMWTHMFIMPLIDFYATACDWMIHTGAPPRGLFWFVMLSFFNGFIIEMGRKIRVPQDEEHGVETYSALWGRQQAVRGWWLAMLLTLASAFLAARQIHFAVPVLWVMGLLLLGGLVLGIWFLRGETPGRGKWIELYAGIWTLALYLMMGVVPMLWRIFFT